MGFNAKEGFFSHPLNRFIMNGDVMPVYSPNELAIKYIQLMKSGQVPTHEQLEAIRKGVIDYCESVHSSKDALEEDVRWINATWPVMYERFKASMGLTQMMLDGGMNSRYFYRYLYNTGKKRFAVALEIKDGYSMPVSGADVFEQIPKGDWALMVGAIEPVHVGRRQTDWLCQSVLRKAKKIFEAGAGLLPAYRRYGYPLGELDQKIVACDSSPDILRFLSAVFDKPLEDYNIEYHVDDLMKVMDDPQYFGQFDVVRMTGLISYFRHFEEKKVLIEKAARLLNDDGVILVDWWLMGASLARSGLINLWPGDGTSQLTPAANAEAAVAEATEICESMGLPFEHINDVCNGNPLCYTQAHAVPKFTLFVIGKNASPSVFDPIPGIYDCPTR